VYASFTSSDATNLIVARVSELYVYKLNKVSSKTHLELCAKYTLFGNIEALNVVRFAKSDVDCIALTFRDAKLTVVGYDSFNCGLVTISMHNFEEDSSGPGLFHPLQGSSNPT
jgi:hypothetical protein